MTQAIQATVDVKDLPISFRYSKEICRFLGHKDLTLAKKELSLVLKKKLAIPLHEFNRDRGHRKGKVGPGAFPQKSTKYILKMLLSGEANASDKGMNVNSLYIKELIPNKGATTWRSRRRRSMAKRTNLKIILEERAKK